MTLSTASYTTQLLLFLFLSSIIFQDDDEAPTRRVHSTLSCTLVTACWKCIFLVSMSYFALFIHFWVVFLALFFH